MGLVAPEVEVEAGCPGRHADHAEVARHLRLEDPRTVDAVGESAGVDEQRHEVVELALEPLQMQPQLLAAPHGEVALHPAEGDGAAKEARAEQALLDPDQPFPQGLRPARGDGEGHVGRDGADVRDVVVDALQLQEHHAEVAGRGGGSTPASRSIAWA